MAITETFALIEVRVKASQAADGSWVPGGYTKYGMVHLTRDDGTDAAKPEAVEIKADGADADVIALAGGGGAAALQVEAQKMNATFEEVRTERDALLKQNAVLTDKLERVAAILAP